MHWKGAHGGNLGCNYIKTGGEKLYKWKKEEGRKNQVNEVKKKKCEKKLHLRMNDMIIFIHLY